MSNTKAAACCAVFITLLLTSVSPVKALELNDLTITFDTIIQTEYEGRRHDPHKSWDRLEAVAGNMIWFASGTACLNTGMSMIYKPGKNTGSVDCPTEREGTSLTYRERGGRGTFETSLNVTGNIVTLQGTMNVNARNAHSYCGRATRTEETETITQSLKLKIIGNKCQVLQYSVTKSRTERKFGKNYDGTPSSGTQTVHSPKGAKCTVVRRSQQPIAAPSAPPASAVGSCG